MAKRERQRIGSIVITDDSNIETDRCICANCQSTIARFENGEMTPSPEELIDQGAIAWPNFGWFCSELCENRYSKEFNMSRNEREAKKVRRRFWKFWR